MSEFDFARMRGVVPVVFQDADSDAVLCIGFMNRAALAATIETCQVTLLNRRSGRLSTARTATGDPVLAQEMWTDSDGESVLVRVHIEGEGLRTERDTFTCFPEPVALNALRR